MPYKEERNFFLSFSGKPSWLTWTEYRVLQSLYVEDAPCEPDANIVGKHVAPNLIRDRIKTKEQAWTVAMAALRSGREKVRQNLPKSAPPKTVVTPTERSSYDLWQSGLKD